MRLVLFILLSTITGFVSSAQNMSEYKASNGIVYHVGDTIKFGRGTGVNSSFAFVQMGTGATAMGARGVVGANWSGFNAIIKKIKKMTIKGATVVYFVVGTGGPARFNVGIEDALAVGEVVNPNKGNDVQQNTLNKQKNKTERLKDLKELLDSGILTQEEFDTEKKKILDEE